MADHFKDRQSRVPSGLPDHLVERKSSGSLGPDCPHCRHDRSHVLDRRDGVRRRRVCSACNTRFTTYEVTNAIPMKAARRLNKAVALINETLGGSFLEEGGGDGSR